MSSSPPVTEISPPAPIAAVPVVASLRMLTSALLCPGFWLTPMPKAWLLLPVNSTLPPLYSGTRISPASSRLSVLRLVMVIFGAPLAVTEPPPRMLRPYRITSPPAAYRSPMVWV